MKKAITAAIILLHAQFCMAEGWSNLGGKTENGPWLEIYPANYYEGDSKLDSDLFVVVSYKSGMRGKGAHIEYKYQRCEAKRSKTTFELIEFSCDKDGVTPLSGTSYKIVPNKNPKDCSYQDMYICIKGCDNPQAPKKMIKEYWECSE